MYGNEYITQYMYGQFGDSPKTGNRKYSLLWSFRRLSHFAFHTYIFNGNIAGMDYVAINATKDTNGSISTLNYYYYDMWQQSGDPRIQIFPLMDGGPWPVLAIIAFYVYFVKVLGPEIMRSRKPFDLRPLIFIYNVTMVIANAFFFYTACVYTNFGLTTWYCTVPDPTAFDLEWKHKLTVSWLFVVSKFVDLFDTVFFVLRKNHRQVSALHVIHHSLLPIDCWIGLKYVPSESAAFMPFINSFIHCLMYSYYALSTLGPKVRPYLWWKRYLTQMQIIQLALIVLHCVYLGLKPVCNLPKIVFLMGMPQALLFLFMFRTFFIKSYGTREQTSKVSSIAGHSEPKQHLKSS